MTDSTSRTPVWLGPQVIVAALLFLAALVFALGGSGEPGPPPTVDLELRGGAATETAEVELAVLDPSGLERVLFVDASLPTDELGRYTAIFGALREALVDTGVWPEQVPAPRVFVQRVAGRTILVLDLEVRPGIPVDVESELRLAGSIAATASRHEADVRYLVNGSSSETLLGHVAVPSALTGN